MGRRGRGLYSLFFQEKPPDKKVLLLGDFIKKNWAPLKNISKFLQSLNTQKPKGHKILLLLEVMTLRAYIYFEP